MSKQYLVNKLDSTLQLIRGTISIDPFGFVPIHEKHVDHEDVIYAMQRDWADLTDVLPTAAKPRPGPAIHIPTPETGMTLEELKAFQKAEVEMAEAAKKMGGVIENDDPETVDPTKPTSARKNKTTKA